MPKKGISVTLRDDNLLWLKSQTVARKGRSLSETLDDLVTTVRTSGRGSPSAIRSVAGTVDIAGDDPGLERADEYVWAVVTSSLSRPFLAREEAPPYTAGKPRKAKRDRRG